MILLYHFFPEILSYISGNPECYPPATQIKPTANLHLDGLALKYLKIEFFTQEKPGKKRKRECVHNTWTWKQTFLEALFSEAWKTSRVCLTTLNTQPEQQSITLCDPSAQSEYECTGLLMSAKQSQSLHFTFCDF